MPLSHTDLKEMKKRGDIEGLINILNIGDVKERREAAFILGELKSRMAVRPLIRLLSKDDVLIRVNAAWALGEIGDADAVLPLIDLLYDPSQNVQLHAAWSLGRIGDNRAIPDLHTAMRNGSSEFRKVANEAIARIESDTCDPRKSTTDIPLVTMDIPSELFECNYLSTMEGDPKNIDEKTINISRDVVLKDEENLDNTHRIILGLKNDFSGSVSIDVLFRYKNNTDGKTRINSVWLQMATRENRITPRSVQDYPELKNVSHEGSRISSQVDSQIASSNNVDSAVKLLSDIGLSGVAKAASAVTQLSGQEDESCQSKLRTLPVDQMYEEIINLGDSIALIEVKLHGKGPGGEMNGKMQLYISKETGIEIANELLCNPPDALCKEFTEDIISTLKETANIFGGQYVSAISEYIEVPILLDAPEFQTGASLQIAESVMKGLKGKVEFVLATDLALGKEKTGRLIMLLDQKSFDVIVSKLF